MYTIGARWGEKMTWIIGVKRKTTFFQNCLISHLFTWKIGAKRVESGAWKIGANRVESGANSDVSPNQAIATEHNGVPEYKENKLRG